MRDKYFTIGRLPELVFGAVLFLAGLICAIYGWQYGLGQLNNIGPGAFPLGLGIIMMVLAILASVEAGREAPVLRMLAPMIFYLPGIILWALLIEGAGLIVATLALIILCSLAEKDLSFTRAIILGLILSLIGYVVFILSFGLTFNLVGNWF